ncbi:XisI protein [Persicitalea sp.]|uniref:XisI protein n=1 Tax=Persicitalea sp. TaxID=3100273 RepID=UPI0035946056
MKNKKEVAQKAVLSILEQFAAYKPVNLPDSENQVIADFERGHFQLVRIGWEGEAFAHNTIFHFDVKSDGKVWIQVNNTDVLITENLMEQGVEKSDIVLGFQPPRYRPYTGYAVA